jgi:hypothetical protein
MELRKMKVEMIFCIFCEKVLQKWKKVEIWNEKNKCKMKKWAEKVRNDKIRLLISCGQFEKYGNVCEDWEIDINFMICIKDETLSNWCETVDNSKIIEWVM